MLIEIRLFGGITVENCREISSVVNVNDVNTCTCINGKLSKCYRQSKLHECIENERIIILCKKSSVCMLFTLKKTLTCHRKYGPLYCLFTEEICLSGLYTWTRIFGLWPLLTVL